MALNKFKILFALIVVGLSHLGCNSLQKKDADIRDEKQHIQKVNLLNDKKIIVEHALPNQLVTEHISSEEFLIGKDDKLNISVYSHENLVTEQSVRPDGKIDFPLAGEIEASGRTPKELREELESRLAKYVRNPRVTVIITEYNSRKVIILGEVASPGTLRLTSDINLLEAISQVGGVTQAADLQGTVLVRNGQALQVNFNRLLRLGDLRHNVRLQDKDFILFPNIAAKKVFVLGEVVKPRSVILKEDVNLVDAILQAGGFSRSAKTANILIIRGGLGSSKILQINFQAMLKQGGTMENLLLQSHDIIYVPKTTIANVLEFFQNLNTILTPIVLAETGISIGPIVKSVITTGKRGEEQPIVVSP